LLTKSDEATNVEILISQIKQSTHYVVFKRHNPITATLWLCSCTTQVKQAALNITQLK